MAIAVTGAAGHLGRLVIDQLKARVAPATIVALARTPEKARDLGVEVRPGDYGRADQLAASLAGIDTLMLISSSEVGQRTAQHRNVIDAAKQAGVGRIVYTSLLRADTSPLSLAGEHVETEAMLRASGIPTTLLRNGWYMENHAAAAKGAVAAGALIGSADDGRIAGALREDYAEAAAVVLTGTGHEGRTYELAGDAPYTLADLAREISRQSGKEVPYRDLSPADYAKALEAMGLPGGLAAAIAGWDAAAAGGALDDNGHGLSKLIGRATAPLSVAVERALR
jgi:NAD(P)H dehydrogenase (quinone)